MAAALAVHRGSDERDGAGVCLQVLEGYPDSSDPSGESVFTWFQGDQCMLGQADVDSGLPYLASTKFGCNSNEILQ